MNYVILFHLFPSDIVYHIYKIIKRENSANHIIQFIKNKKNKDISLKIIILELFNYEIIGNFQNIQLFKKVNFDSVKQISNNNFHFLRNFWIHLLNILSFKLNLIRNHIHINHLNHNHNHNYVLYKKFYSYWFELCKKYNIKLLVIKKPKFNSENYENLFIASRRLGKLKSEIKLFRFPYVLDDGFNQISIQDSQNYILNF